MNKEIQKAHKKLMVQSEDYAALVKKHGKLEFTPKIERSPYESLVRSIAYQQLHANAARSILGRMMASVNGKKMEDLKNKVTGISAAEAVLLPFPEPKQILKLSDDKMRSFGFSASKTKSIKDIALKTKEGIIPGTDVLIQLSDQEIVDRLTQAFGVGPWTVHMMLIFQMGRLDVWPVNDFGVQAGFKNFYRKRLHPKPKDLQKAGVRWAPYRTLAALYLWKEADSRKKKPTPSQSKS
jgi:DNA-3-methyladenine glycosylase II